MKIDRRLSASTAWDPCYRLSLWACHGLPPWQIVDPPPWSTEYKFYASINLISSQSKISQFDLEYVSIILINTTMLPLQLQHQQLSHRMSSLRKWCSN